MSTNSDDTPQRKASKAMARCIVTGVGSSVLTYLVWKTVLLLVPQAPISFHMTCAFVFGVSILATGSALFRLARPEPVVKKAVATRLSKRSVTPKSSSPVIPLSFGKDDMAWFQRN